jgi:hypothetical protein
MWRRMGIGAVLASIAVALSGCVVFMSPPTAKRGKHSVTITVKGCASRSSSPQPPGSCPQTGNSNQNAVTASGKDHQVFLGFLVPKSASAPKAFTASTGPIPGGGKLKFKLTKSYTKQLQKGAPAPSSKKWYGYTSQFFAYNQSSGEQNFNAKATFGLPKGFTGKFAYRAVVGARLAVSTTTTIRCGKPLTKVSTQNGHEIIICIDDSATGSA